MHWLATAHVRRYPEHDPSDGPLGQGRFQAFPVRDDDHRRVVLRYSERNPRHAGRVRRAEDWPWSSLRWRRAGAAGGMPHPGPVARGAGWEAWVNDPLTEGELERVRPCAAEKRIGALVKKAVS